MSFSSPRRACCFHDRWRLREDIVHGAEGRERSDALPTDGPVRRRSADRDVDRRRGATARDAARRHCGCYRRSWRACVRSSAQHHREWVIKRKAEIAAEERRKEAEFMHEGFRSPAGAQAARCAPRRPSWSSALTWVPCALHTFRRAIACDKQLGSCES